MTANLCRYLLLSLILVMLLGGCRSSKKASKKREKEKKEIKESKKETKKETQEVINTARSYKGTPYKFGGTTRAGMDCSGLLYMSYQSVNKKIPRTSADMAKYGKKVDLKEIQEGDWVFFAADKGSNKITHVGLVTEVRGREDIRFIHASTKLGVIEDNLFVDHYRKIFVQVRRPF